ncbi:MAG: TetR family transcriptional regulator [Salinicola sp.]|uniref:TetR family transcriptional regulator n=1 Tax=Salinicola sp. TaxID=1978524 RepID=UPI001D2F8577|nr:TetR family transcriptional regulator [Salinicola sp.]NRB55910.1 TetR family transcriptional regulator [Salinicola sp.]
MPKRTKAEAEATREALLDAAEVIFLERGVSRTSLEQIARQAGMTRGAVYWHFKNKSDLFHAMLDRVKMPLRQLLDDVEDAERPRAPLESLQLAAMHALERLQSPRSRRVHTILFHCCEASSDVNILELHQRLADDCYDTMLERFEEANRTGTMIASIEPEIACRMLMSMFGGLMHDWLRDPTRYDIGDIGPRMIDTFFERIAPCTPHCTSPSQPPS